MDGCLLDSNILLRLTWLSYSESARVGEVCAELLRQGRILFFTLQNATEFWNVCTRPVAANGLALSSEETAAGLRAIERQVSLLTDTPDVFQHWTKLVRHHGIIGKQVHDARLAAAMLAHGVPEILTLNPRHFSRFENIRVTTPEYYT